MKKFILLFLLIPSLCFAVEPIDFSKSIAMSPAMLGLAGGAAASTSAFCTSATACNAVGACDILCEDFAGGTTCRASGDADPADPDHDNCRNGYILEIGTNGTVDFNATASPGLFGAGSLCPGTTVSPSMKITVADGGQSYIAKNLGGDSSIAYVQFYYLMKATGLANGADETIASGGADVGGTQMLWYVAIHNTSGVYSLKVRFLDSSSTWIIKTGPNISTSTWYRIVVLADKTNSHGGFWVNGTDYASSPFDIIFSTRSQQYQRLLQAVVNTEGEFNLWTIDNDVNADPAACPQ